MLGRRQRQSPARSEWTTLDQTDRQLRWIVLLYVGLLVLEGAMRKWMLPSLSNALLLCRDPLVILAYVVAYPKGRFPTNSFVVSLALWTLLCGLLTTFIGHGSLFVTLYGIRTDFLHIPFAFIIGRVLRANDVVQIGKWWLWGTIPMTVLLVMQFYAPQSAWVNLSVGGIETEGFGGAMGRNRPPGTFSFTNGVTLFYTYSTAFLVSGLTHHKKYSSLLLAASGAAVLIGVPISISRSLMILALFTFLVGVFSSSFQRGAIMRYLRLLFIATVTGLIALQLPVFDDAKETFGARWENSTGEDKGGVKEAIVDRVWTMLTDPIKDADELPIAGFGIGMGTQVGSQLLTGDEGFNLGESEWSRIIGESGLILGGLFILWRAALCVKLFQLSMLSFLRRNGLPFIFLSALAFNLLTGQVGQTTVNGFVILGIGLTLGSIRLPKKQKPKTVNEDDQICSQTEA